MSFHIIINFYTFWIFDSLKRFKDILSFLFQMILAIIPITIDGLRAFTGPMPSFICTFDIFMKNVVMTSSVLFMFAIICTKFSFIFVFKSIPAMNDSFLSTFICIASYMITILASSSRIFHTTKPIMNKVRFHLYFQCLISFVFFHDHD